VADLAGREAVAHHQVAVEHQTGADTLADLDEEEAALGGPTQPELAERGGVGVVGHVDRDAQGLGQDGGQLDALPPEVGGLEDDAGGIDDARAADADAEEGPVGGVGEIDAQLGGQVEGGVAPPAVPLRRPAVEHLAAEVDQGGSEAGVVAQVERDREAGIGDQPEQRGGLAHPLVGPGAELLDQALGQQLGRELGRGGPGQAGGAGQVGPAHWAGAKDGAEDQRAVVPAGVTRDGLAPWCAAAGEGRVAAVGWRCRRRPPGCHGLFV
jgi:hypothetical protein